MTRIASFAIIIASLVLIASAEVAQGGSIVYVDDDAALGGDGVSWDTAYRYIQDALTYASDPKNNVLEIHIGQGIYFPDQDEGNPNGNGDRFATFELIASVALMGGYAGFGADDPDARDVGLYETILNGDLAENDGPDFLNNEENTLHIVTSKYTNEAPTLSGFTITAANANVIGENIDDRGGGLTLWYTTVVVEQCRFVANMAYGDGACVWSKQTNSSFTNCTFQESVVCPRGHSAGIHNVFGSSMTLIDCLFLDNHVCTENGGGGAAIFIGGDCCAGPLSTLIAESCVFVGNSALTGGAINNHGISSIANCLFVGNYAHGDGQWLFSGKGGAITNLGELAITNSTFVANSAIHDGGAIYAGADDDNPNSYDIVTDLSNCILWGNTGSGSLQDQQFGTTDTDVFVNYSCIAGLTGSLGGAGNVAGNPEFIDPNGPDGIPGTMDDNLRLGSGSVCIDAADNTALPKNNPYDLDGNLRVIDDPDSPNSGVGGCPIVDMGSYEFQSDTAQCCPWDLDDSGSVGTGDLLELFTQWGTAGTADFDESGEVGTGDLLVLFANWGLCNTLYSPCGDDEAGPCLFANENPGCEDEECCSAVCTLDPSCCLIEWDQLCADQALITCSAQNCPGEGNCWESNGTPGCSDALCCNIVCEIDPSCCLVEWDQQCVNQAMPICTAPNCPGEGNCSESNGTPGCDYAFCCNIVCEFDPLCCYAEWDETCANAAAELCPACGNEVSGSCFIANPTPYCDDAECCELVCEIDSVCCEVEWDAGCVGLAELFCEP